jgi:hypothetical protein
MVCGRSLHSSVGLKRQVLKPLKRTQLLNGRQRFDAQKYLEMLIEAGETLFGVFGYDLEKIRSYVVYGEKRLVLG